MRIFITGASGTVGRQILADRLTRGDQIVAMTRSRTTLLQRLRHVGVEESQGIEIIEADPGMPGPWQQAVDGCDAVIHLAGAGVMDQRWSTHYRQVLRESRIDSTYQVVRAIEQASRSPRVLLNASAVGFYGDRGDRKLVESDVAGEGFLSQLCAEWEAQALRAEPGCRVVCMRLGMVLDAHGGALPRLVKLFRRGLGGRLGHGRQYISWITMPDLVVMIRQFLRREEIRGPVNVVSPEPVTNRVFTAALARAVHRPAVLPAPGFALRAALGAGAEVVLSSQRVFPKVAMDARFEWRSPTIDRAFRATLGDQNSVNGSGSRMLVIDIDDLSPGSPLLRHVLREANGRGADIVLATSMGADGAREFLKQAGLECPVIIADGAAVIRREQADVLDSRCLDPDMQEGLLEAMAGCASQVRVTLEDAQGNRHEGSLSEPPRPLAGCIRLRAEGPPGGLAAVLGAISPGWWRTGRIQVHRDRPGRLEVLHALADRGVAIQKLARRWNVAQSDVGAVLGAVRSCGLAEWSGSTIALSGSDERLRRLCDRTSRLGGIDGVAEAVEELLH